MIPPVLLDGICAGVSVFLNCGFAYDRTMLKRRDSMDETRFTPPPPIDRQTREELMKAVDNMTELDWFLAKYKVEHDPYIQEKYIKPLKKRDKERKKHRRQEWWWSKGIQIVNLILALIAAVTGIIALLR